MQLTHTQVQGLNDPSGCHQIQVFSFSLREVKGHTHMTSFWLLSNMTLDSSCSGSATTVAAQTESLTLNSYMKIQTLVQTRGKKLNSNKLFEFNRVVHLVVHRGRSDISLPTWQIALSVNWADQWQWRRTVLIRWSGLKPLRGRVWNILGSSLYRWQNDKDFLNITKFVPTQTDQKSGSGVSRPHVSVTALQTTGPGLSKPG